MKYINIYIYIYIYIYLDIYTYIFNCSIWDVGMYKCRCKIDAIYHVSISNIQKAICRTKTYLKDQLNNVINLTKNTFIYHEFNY